MESRMLWVFCKVSEARQLCKRPEVFMIPGTFQKIEFIAYIFILL